MAAYTKIQASILDNFWQDYKLGEILEYTEIINGISNSNYLIHSSEGEYVLTLYEDSNSKNAPHLANLIDHLSNQYPLSPTLQKDTHNRKLRSLENKPAIVCTKLAGHSVDIANSEQCLQLGNHLAQIHLLLKNYQLPIDRNNDLPTVKHNYIQIRSQLKTEDRIIIEDELNFQQSLNYQQLPTGLTHGDLFRDNVLFSNQDLSGIIDFHSASNDYLIRDLAIAINDWCQIANNLSQQHLSSLLNGYNQIRPLTQLEKAYLPHMLRHCALRFWLSRLKHNINNQSHTIANPTNPDFFKKMLIQYRNGNQRQLCELINESFPA